MNREELQRYGERIGLDEMPAADARGLEIIQRAHLETVPFENLDIVNGRIPLALDEAAQFDSLLRQMGLEPTR